MKYFRNRTTEEVFGYEADQQDLIDKAEADPVMEDITGSWPPVVDPLVVKANEVRAKRDSLLFQSDWTQVEDAPVDKAAWASYREALRDITKQSNFPTSVAWPAKPQ
jgi:hypothetical protein